LCAPAERLAVSQNFAFTSYAPGAGTGSTVSTVTAGVSLTVNARYAFQASGKCFIRFGPDTSTNATTGDLWLPTDQPFVFDTRPGYSFVSFLSASGSVTVSYARIS
jgi:hypothetical protein